MGHQPSSMNEPSFAETNGWGGPPCSEPRLPDHNGALRPCSWQHLEQKELFSTCTPQADACAKCLGDVTLGCVTAPVVGAAVCAAPVLPRVAGGARAETLEAVQYPNE